MYFFDIISLNEKSTTFWHTIFDVISTSRKWTSPFFDGRATQLRAAYIYVSFKGKKKVFFLLFFWNKISSYEEWNWFMLTIFIKSYCNNAAVNVKFIYFIELYLLKKWHTLMSLYNYKINYNLYYERNNYWNLI